ncbi:glycosyltransferase [Gottfriedia luciferensis]|uniref:glycosyltransferase n=1 Tax=Gottfriedia luciferensis TaxID=178774 RepID=UPI000B44BA48|nr:glycosyltransferase family 2 protein [Gottfriedia luciferensis]
MNKFTFVILHYLAEQDTIECIESILNNIDYPNYDIVVVDNASYNESMKNIIAKFNEIENVYFIESDENLGFAKGNNLGFRFAKNELNSDFICLINNDTIFEQKDFITKVVKIYEEEKFAVLGPDIIARDGRHQNPARETLVSYEELERDVKMYEEMLKNSSSTKWKYTYIIKTALKTNLKKFKLARMIKRAVKKNPNKPINHLVKQENIQLHGSCLIFSSDYISKYDGLYSETFMFMEEDILLLMSQRDHFKMLYSPEIKMYHKEDASTDYILKSSFEKRKFILENYIVSGKILLRLMKEKETIKA